MHCRHGWVMSSLVIRRVHGWVWLLLVSALSVGLEGTQDQAGPIPEQRAASGGGGALPVRGHALGGERASYRWHLPCAGDGGRPGPGAVGASQACCF